MGKRSDLGEFKPRDYWPTIDPAAITGTFASKIYGRTYVEPCYGGGHLYRLLQEHSKAFCTWASDLEPQQDKIAKINALEIQPQEVENYDFIITNPPYSWNMLMPLLEHLPTLLPTWLLLPADFMHNVRSQKYMDNCSDIITVGRLYWQENKVKGKDNFCWYLFQDEPHRTIFHGR